MTVKPWLVICSCGWQRACSSEWAAQSIAKLHPQLASMDVAHVTRVEGPGATSLGQQLTLGNAEHEGPGRDDSARRDIKSRASDIEYRDHFIVVQSYESEGRRWRPKAILSIYRSGRLQQQILSAPDEVLLESEEAAETYSLAMAKTWIDAQD
jgi:hypothetical protein